MKTSVFVGTSLDGFIARLNGAFDFLFADGEVDGESNGYNAFFSTVDAVLMGRNTYEVVLPFPEWPYGTTPVFVLSSRPIPPAPHGAVVEPISGPPNVVLSQLTARAFQHLYIDGGVTIQQFLRAGLISRIVVTRVPVLIGTGIPLFGALDADSPGAHRHSRLAWWCGTKRVRRPNCWVIEPRRDPFVGSTPGMPPRMRAAGEPLR